MKIFKFLNEKFEITICVVLLSVMSSLLAVQVFMRYVMKASLSWSEELARYIFIWLIYLGISYGASIMKHIKIEAALNIFPAKAIPYVVIVGDVIFLCFSLFICGSGYGIVRRQLRLGQTSPAIGIPMWIVYAAPMVGFGLTALREIQTIRFRVRRLRQNPREGEG
jgi:TRAP-type C4-dicarboxylate transport system permease small subunit